MWVARLLLEGRRSGALLLVGVQCVDMLAGEALGRCQHVEGI